MSPFVVVQKENEQIYDRKSRKKEKTKKSVLTYVLTKKLMGPFGESMPPTMVKPRLFLPGPFS
jgi:hypothetical protein